MPVTDILNTRYGLRRLLQNTAYHATDGGIPKDDLTADKEPHVHATIKELAAAIVENPAVLLVDEYTEDVRRKDWKTLLRKEVMNKDTDTILGLDARSRPGHKILDHHMPHFYAVANHKGISVESLAQRQETVEKALLANLAMHSTPYKSEIRRMLMMTAGLSSVTKYRAAVAKAVVAYWGATRVLDPCAGWGGRMLGALVGGARAYVGCEPDPRTAAGLRAILADPALPALIMAKARILEMPVENAWSTLRTEEPFDMVLTSPPYFNLELYTGGPQSVTRFPTWSQWVAEWLEPTIRGCLALLKPTGVSCWSVKNIRTDRLYPLADEVDRIHAEAGWELKQTITMRGSARPGAGRIQDGKETRESEEETYVYLRKSI